VLLLQLRLALLFSLFLSRVAWELLFLVRTTLLTIVGGAVITWILVAHLIAPAPHLEAAIFPAVHPQAPENLSVLLTEQQIREKILANQEILRIQPTHRDILLNTAQLHLALGEVEQSERYLQQARLLDPNHPTFSAQ